MDDCKVFYVFVLDTMADKVVYNNTQSAVQGRVGSVMVKKLAKFDEMLKKSTSGYLVGDSPTVADFCFFGMTSILQERMKPLIINYTSIIAHYQKIKNMKSIDQYYKEEHKGDGPLEKKGLELVYFDSVGRAESIRLACRHGNITFRDIRVNQDTLTKMKEEGLVPFGQLPVMFIDGVPLAQSIPILRYVGKLSTCTPQLYPSDDLVAAKIDATLAQIGDLVQPISVLYHPEHHGWKLDEPPKSGENTKKKCAYTYERHYVGSPR